MAVAAIAASGCGDESTSTTDPSAALEYMPAEPAFLAILDTDVDGEQVEAFEDTVGDGWEGGDVEKLLEDALEGSPVSYEDDVKPLLGGPLVAAVEDAQTVSGGGGDMVAALVVDDEDKARETLEKIDGAEQVAYVGDGVVVAAAGPEALARARGRKDAGEGLDPAVVDEAMLGLPDDALLKLYADVDDGVLELPELSGLTKMPWFDALRTFGGTVSFDGSNMHADALLSTDPVDQADLPVVPGTDEAPEIVRREGWISGANLDQSRATAFLLRAVRAAFPDSDFVRDVATVERERKIDFEQEFLRQFNGPSQSLLAADGGFAARSAVRDPERLAATMEKIAPDLGRLVEDLQGLQSSGLGVLLLLAPDAPAATSVLGSANVSVRPLRDDLYRMSGLVGPGPDEIVFGLVGDVFVVAEDEEAAEEIANAPAEAFDGPPGPAVVQASGVALQEAGADFLGIDSVGRLASEVTGSLSAEETGLRGSLVAEFAE
jgi:CheY-like chemotaxis protein